MFRLVIEKAPPNNQMELLSVYTHIGVRPRKSLEQRGNKASTTDGYWVVKEGDIICNKLLAWMGAIGVSHYQGVTSPAYDILRPIKSCNTDYYHFLFRTKKYLQQFKLRSRGIMDMRLRLYFDQFGQIPIPVPPRPEQNQIVAYLLAQDAHIARFIKAKRELIKLLNEQKLRIIDQAVTRGLDASVALKPSGIEWLGEVPEHWDVPLIKHVADVRFSGVDKHSHDGEMPVRLCNYTDVYRNDRITGDMDLMRATATAAEISRLTLRAGDVLLTKDSETPDDIGVPAWVPEDLPGVVCAYHLGLLRPEPDRVLGEFMFRAIGSTRTARQLHILATGVTRFALGKHDVKNAVIALPPVEEQKSICLRIAHECQPLDDAIARAEDEIKLIREYRDRLIADVVTGQIDVRSWQPGPEDRITDEDLTALGDDNDNRTTEEEPDGDDGHD
jgi:type I restriction enzyme S subunit